MSSRKRVSQDDLSLPLEGAFAGLTVMEYLGILFPERSSRALRRLFDGGRVRSQGLPVSSRRRVAELRDLVVARGLDDLPEIFRTGDECGISIIYEDESVSALSKPSGVPVVPDRTSGRESCLGYLLGKELDARRDKPLARCVRPRIVHRIDRWTSGLVIAARTPDAERELARYLEESRVEKEYLALLAGDVGAAKTSVRCPVLPGRKGKMRAGPGGKPALTHFEVLQRFGHISLVVARPRTGRTHQIRVHAFAMGHPVVADPLYARKAADGASQPPPLERLALHAWRYTLPEAWPGRRSYECPLPADFREALRTLLAMRGMGEPSPPVA